MRGNSSTAYYLVRTTTAVPGITSIYSFKNIFSFVVTGSRGAAGCAV